MKIKLILPEFRKFNLAHSAVERFLKRIQKLTTKMEIHEFRLERNGTDAYKKEKEKERILKLLKNTDLILLCDEQGEDLPTQLFTKKLETLSYQNPNQNLCFIIGGPYGLHMDLKTQGQFAIKLSSLTLTSEIAIVLLIEQIYRALSILSGHPYHKN